MKVARYLCEEKSVPICVNCGHHKAMHVEGKCLFGPTRYMPLPSIGYRLLVRDRGYRRFATYDERLGAMRCCTKAPACYRESFFVKNLSGARLVSCVRCLVRLRRICKNCGLTTDEHYEADHYCIYGDGTYLAATRFDKKLRALYGYA